MSRFWKDMFITPTSPSIQDIISIDTPIDFNLPTDITIKTSLDNSQIDNIITFVNTYNRTSTGIITTISKEMINCFKSLNSYILTLYGNNIVIGCIISLPLSIKTSDKIIKHGCSTYLCIHPNLRNLGLCMSLIRKLAQIGHQDGILCGYHLNNSKISPNALEIRCWYRPLNLKKVRDAGFNFPSYKRSSDRNNIRDQMIYSTKLSYNIKVVQISTDNINSVYEYYTSLIGDKKFVYSPDLTEFTQFINNIDSYVIYEKDFIIGIFSLWKVHNINLSIAYLIFSCGDILNPAIYISHVNGYDLLYGYIIGDIIESKIEEIKGIKTKTPLWLNLYNNSIELKVTDVVIPLL